MARWYINKYFRMLVAICAGNAIYFGLFHFLPARLQHSPFRPDAGLLFDFLLCVFLWFVLPGRNETV